MIYCLQEWSDYYTDANVKDLHRFFDFYLKGIKNDWESTPKVRLSILQFGLGTIDHIFNRSEYDFPIPRTQYRRYYLSESGLVSVPPNKSSKSYSSKDDCLTFSWIHSACETTGFFSINLRMSTDHEDMDVYAFVEVYRANCRQGVLCINPQRAAIKFLLKLMHDWQIGVNNKGFIFYWGPNGCLRSRQAESQSKQQRILKFDMKQCGISWQQDDEMRLTICGQQPKHLILPGVKEAENINKGLHTIHFGEDSYLVVPHV